MTNQTTDNGLLTTDNLALIERASRGVVPCDLAVCTTLLDAAGKIEGAARVVRWIALAQARLCPEFRQAEAGGRGKKSPWLEWAKEHYPEYGDDDHLRQMAQVGAFLVQCRSLNPITCKGVYDLDFSKLYCLSRLPENLIGPYLERYEVEALTRDQVRSTVNSFLRAAGVAGGEESGEKTGRAGARRAQGKPEQMDFLDTLFGVVEKTIDDETHRKLVENPRVKALDSAITGLHLVGVAVEKWSVSDKIDETILEETIDELDKLRASLLERLAQHGPLKLEA